MRCGTLRFGCGAVAVRCSSVDRLLGVYAQGTIIIMALRLILRLGTNGK